MSKKFKAIIHSPRVMNWNRKSRKIAKKYKKFDDNDKYPQEYRINWIRKRFKKLMKFIDVELEVIGYDNLPKAPAILAPNHQSSMDPGILLWALENPDPSPDVVNGSPVFLAKIELLNDKKAKGHAVMLDTFYIDRKKPREALEQINAMSEYAKDNKRYQVIFPEGTRTIDGKLNDFKSGAFRSAKKSFSPIVPVTINNSFSITDLTRTGTLKVQVVFHQPMKPMSFMTQDTKSIAANVQRIVAKAWIAPTGKRSAKEDKS